MAIVDADAGAETAGRYAASAFRNLFSSYAEHRKRRRQIAELRSLGPTALKDLGIDRSEVCSIVHGAGRDTSRIR